MKTQIITIVGIIDAKAAIEYYKKVFKENCKIEDINFMENNSELVMHADLMLFDTRIMLHDSRICPSKDGIKVKDAKEFQESQGKVSMSFYVYVPNADPEYNNAVENGMEIAYPIEDAFWGDRFGSVKDKFGVNWSFAHPLNKTQNK